MSSVAATRLRKGNLVKHNNELCRIVETQHVTPGNLRGFVRAKMRKVKDGIMFEHRFRSEDMVERAMLDEREMQYLYKDGDTFYFMDTASLRADRPVRGGARRLDELPAARVDDQRRVLRGQPGRHRAAADRRPQGHRHRARDQGRDGQRPDQAGHARDRPRRDGPGIRRGRYRASASTPRRASTSRAFETAFVIRPSAFVRPYQGPKADGRWPSLVECFVDRPEFPASHPLVRVDRSHRRQHVQRQERRAHSPAAARPDREAARAGLQAGHRQPLLRDAHHLAQRDAAAVAAVGRAADILARRARRHRSRRHRRRAVLRRRAARRCAARWPIAASG